MKFTPTEIPEVIIIEPRVFEDERGYFFESFNQIEFEDNVGPVNFVQDNESMSAYGVLRGLHYQLNPHAQAKLVGVVKGKILDVAVDIRKGSPTYGRHVALELNDQNKLQLFIPRGFAHGFVALSEQVIVHYKCDNFYNKAAEGGMIFDDPALGIDWVIPKADIILSEKDGQNKSLAEADNNFVYGQS